jgi:hypothetical protein
MSNVAQVFCDRRWEAGLLHSPRFCWWFSTVLDKVGGPMTNFFLFLYLVFTFYRTFFFLCITPLYNIGPLTLYRYRFNLVVLSVALIYSHSNIVHISIMRWMMKNENAHSQPLHCQCSHTTSHLSNHLNRHFTHKCSLSHSQVAKIQGFIYRSEKRIPPYKNWNCFSLSQHSIHLSHILLSFSFAPFAVVLLG